MTGWLQADGDTETQLALLNLGHLNGPNLTPELVVGLAEASIAPTSVQIIPRPKPASLAPVQEPFHSTLSS